MAGYLFGLDSIESLNLYSINGVYSTKLKIASNSYWSGPNEGTFADYSTMKPGDNVYFFIKRKIYGIGELVDLENQGCSFSNFEGACLPIPFKYKEKKSELLWDEGDESINQRWICVFKPSPHFFKIGIDMDDVLSSNPAAFKMLRAFWKLSFIKFDDEENQAFKDVILKFNQENLEKNENNFDKNFRSNHQGIALKIKEKNYSLKIEDILNSCSEEDKIKHEMAIEAGILFQLSKKEVETINIFGDWDYLSHQVIASPFKPIDYMDKMDLFGYSFIKGFSPTKSKYLIAELKKDEATIEDIEQVLKYVDWIKDEYCFNDYSMINAFLVAYDFPDEVISHKKTFAKRQFTIGRRPAQSLEWENLRLINYRFNKKTSKLSFEEII